MNRKLPFFTTMVSNMDMVLAKSDIHISYRYAELVDDAALRDSIFKRLSNEWNKTIDAVNRIMEQQARLESNPLPRPLHP